MKKISRRNFLLASGVVTIGAALAACGGSSSTSAAGRTAAAGCQSSTNSHDTGSEQEITTRDLFHKGKPPSWFSIKQKSFSKNSALGVVGLCQRMRTEPPSSSLPDTRICSGRVTRGCSISSISLSAASLPRALVFCW